MVEIPVDKLREVFDILLETVAPEPTQSLIIHKEAFWSVPADQAYEIYSEPRELTIGMVSDSWGQLEAIAADQDRSVGYGLVWLAEVLRAIGDESNA
ncbi:hypothetical protein ACFY2W_24835 [Streptomyces sp. NPDC001262]|uniref:hypothetical protein n=1 Tax=Streptomyces sp. NPDC001262 TaxID=3364552 RepID=UPI00368BA829